MLHHIALCCASTTKNKQFLFHPVVEHTKNQILPKNTHKTINEKASRRQQLPYSKVADVKCQTLCGRVSGFRLLTPQLQSHSAGGHDGRRCITFDLEVAVFALAICKIQQIGKNLTLIHNFLSALVEITRQKLSKDKTVRIFCLISY